MPTENSLTQQATEAAKQELVKLAQAGMAEHYGTMYDYEVQTS